jgi:hypothetical protein
MLLYYVSGKWNCSDAVGFFVSGEDLLRENSLQKYEYWKNYSFSIN